MAEPLKIKDLPIDARPREAFMRSADPVREIPDETLLAILIRTGQKGSSAIDIAQRLIKYFSGSSQNLVEKIALSERIQLRWPTKNAPLSLCFASRNTAACRCQFFEVCSW